MPLVRKFVVQSSFAKRRLMVIDDDCAVRKTLVLMASRLNAEVLSCSNMQEFEAGMSSFKPDILLVDLMMPNIDGIDVISSVGRECDAAIYIITGADKRTIEASCEVLKAAGVNISGYLRKPFLASELNKLIEGSDLRRIDQLIKFPLEASSNLFSEDEFREAVFQNKVEPYFQPIIDASNFSIKGFEALLRVDCEKGSSFFPQYLNYMVVNPCLASHLTNIAIEKSLSFLNSLPFNSTTTISLNIFGSQAVENGFRESLVEACQRSGVQCNRLILELSEATVFELNDHDYKKLTQLRLAGFGLSVDDFGTGNSSLSRLAKLPFSEIKIDKSFCINMSESSPAMAIVEACIDLARKMDMRITAEGVETLESASLLAQMGCNALQGYFFGKALPASEAAKLVNPSDKVPFPLNK